MNKVRKLRSAAAGLIAGSLSLCSALAAPLGSSGQRLAANASSNDENCIFHDTFETGKDGWEGRGGAETAIGTNAYAGSSALAVSGRNSAWNGAMKPLSAVDFSSGEVYSFSIAASGSGNMMLSLQYTNGEGKTEYSHIASGKSEGDYIVLTNTEYTLPEGSDLILYVETEEGTEDFCIDEAFAAKAGTQPDISGPAAGLPGDFNIDGCVNVFDLIAAKRAIFSEHTVPSTDIAQGVSDVDGDGSFGINDIVILANFILGRIDDFPESTATTTTTTTTTTETTTTTTSPSIAPGEFMNSIRDQVTPNVPADVLKNAEGSIEHITYFSKKANRNKGANVWLPPGYDESKKYPVFYVNHGYGGDESSMVNGMGVREIATNLIKSGDAEPMIIVFTNQYTDPQHEKQTGNGQADVPGYDNFVEDLPDSLMPYIESHYPVKTGRENTAIAGFSMGGREALYIGMKCCDKIGYIGGGAPAPGIFPTKDQFMDHPGVMSKEEMRIDPPYSPYLLMIAGGTNDGMVNDYPKQYSDLFTEHGTDNIFISVPGGGHDSSTVIPLMYNFIKNLFKAV